MTDKEHVRALLERIGLALESTSMQGNTYVSPWPLLDLLAGASDVIDDLAIRAGLWGPPRTVSGTPRAHPPGAARAAPAAAPQGRRDEVHDATVQNIALAITLPDTSPGCAPLDTSPSDSGCDTSGGGEGR